jgi:hypothetical protein
MSFGAISSERLAFGSALGAGARANSSPRHLRCTILRVNPNKGRCDVYGEGCLYSDVPFPGMTTSPTGTGGTFEIPKVGTPVLVRVSNGIASISQMLPVPTGDGAESKPRFSVLETQPDTNLYPSNDGPTMGRLPLGMQPGDWCRMGDQGQCLAVLEGGVAKLKASPLAQVEAIGSGDTLKLTGHNLEMITGFGHVSFASDGGKNAFLFEGGTDQITQVGAGRTNWQVRARVGGQAEGLADFQLLNLRGERLFTVSLKDDGSVESYRKGHTYETYGGDRAVFLNQGDRRTLMSGDDVLRVVDGSRITTIAANDESQTFGTKTSMIAGARRDNIRNDWSMAVGKTVAFTISGATIPTPITNALSFKVTKGSVYFDVGDPLAGDIPPSAISSFRVFTKSPGGQIELHAGKTGFVHIDSDMPIGSVWLGGNAFNIPTEPAVLGMQLISLLGQIAGYLDLHMHLLPPSLSMYGPSTLMPVVQNYLSAVSAAVPTLVSKKVLVGR